MRRSMCKVDAEVVYDGDLRKLFEKRVPATNSGYYSAKWET